MESAAQSMSIVSKVGQLLVDEVQDIRGVGDKVVHLMDELSTMNAVLRMISEADQSTVDHLMREWEKQVRELAYDAEDCADIYRLRVNRAPSLSCGRFVVTWPKYRLQKLLLQRGLAADVKALLARTCAVSERRARYGIDQAALTRSPWFTPVMAASASANTLRRADDPEQFVGIKEQAAALAERIKAEDNDRKLKVFSIVGFGGLGKTTLAVELCRQLDADFQHQALVSVSQAFDAEKDMKGLLARVLKQIVKLKDEGRQQTNEAVGTSTTTTQGNHQLKIDKIDEMDVAELWRHLKEQLMKRYLIVIDDVWSLPAWEAIHIKLPENNCSSRIIVTTRIEIVAKASSVSEDLVHHMKPLKLEDSEKLFIKRVFGSMGGTCPVGLKDNMDKILNKCGGLPLAIVSIASLLASYSSAKSIEMWEKVSKSIGSQMESHPTLEGMRQVITLSYDYLPHNLKACMMYLSTFPEDYVIIKDRLLYRWIAEGLVAEKRGLTLFDVAEEYFNELISRNMIQPDKLQNRRILGPEMIEACRVHDMMLEVMVSKSQDANFVSLVGRQYRGGLPRGKVRRLSIHGNDDDNKRAISPKKEEAGQRHRARHGIETMNLQHVRSLTTFQSEGLQRLLDRLGEFKLLRVLDLEDCKALQDKHMRDICRLCLLRFLSLRNTPIWVMPSEIGDLEYLETLDLEGTLIQDMPPTVAKLSKLERLRVDLWTRPRGLGNMKALRELSCVQLEGDVQAAQDVGELQRLQVLYLFQITETSEEFLHALASSLSKICTLRSLYLYGNTDFLLHVSSPPPLLRHLSRLRFTGRFPDWISSLKHLAEITVEGWFRDASGQVILDSLCKLPSLQRIELRCRRYGQEGELIARTTHDFPALSILDLSFTGGYPEVFKFEEGSMTKLETLLLLFSHKEVSIVGVENLKNLKEVKLRDRNSSPSLKRAVEQLKLVNENRTESNQIKVIVG